MNATNERAMNGDSDHAIAWIPIMGAEKTDNMAQTVAQVLPRVHILIAMPRSTTLTPKRIAWRPRIAWHMSG